MVKKMFILCFGSQQVTQMPVGPQNSEKPGTLFRAKKCSKVVSESEKPAGGPTHMP